MFISACIILISDWFSVGFFGVLIFHLVILISVSFDAACPKATLAWIITGSPEILKYGYRSNGYIFCVGWVSGSYLPWPVDAPGCSICTLVSLPNSFFFDDRFFGSCHRLLLECWTSHSIFLSLCTESGGVLFSWSLPLLPLSSPLLGSMDEHVAIILSPWFPISCSCLTSRLFGALSSGSSPYSMLFFSSTGVSPLNLHLDSVMLIVSPGLLFLFVLGICATFLLSILPYFWSPY